MCIECGKSNATKVVVDKHIIFQTMEKQYSCRKCGKAFKPKFFVAAYKKFYWLKAIYMSTKIYQDV